jgi:DNA-binding PadR family transcriptional regulator
MDGMALDIFILSVLRAGPVHGYELKRRVQRPTLATLSNNSLYPMLRRFESEGIVTSIVEEQDGKPARKIYAITEAGRQHLGALISTLPAELAANDEEFLVRFSFFNEISAEQRLAILGARSAVLDAAIAQVGGLIAESENAESENPQSEKAEKRAWRNLAMTQLLERLERERQWIATMAKKATRHP